jgi:hypothetical protein
MIENLSIGRAYNPTAVIGICGTGYEGVPSLASDPCRVISRSGASRPLYLKDAAFHAQMRRYYESAWW